MTDVGVTPKSSERTIQDHLRNYYTLLKSGESFSLSSLYDFYKASRPSLHKLMSQPQLDLSALNYALNRLPLSVLTATDIILAFSRQQLIDSGYNLTDWELQGSPARRRQNYYHNADHVLAVIINTDSDIDDFINCLIAVEIERQKFSSIDGKILNELIVNEKSDLISLTAVQFDSFKKMLGDNWQDNLAAFSQYHDLKIKSLPGSEKYILDTVSAWWHKISVSSLIFGFDTIPLYFVSSNMHSLSNIIGGYVSKQQDYIINHIEKNYPALYTQWLDLKSGTNSLRVIDFLYYVSGKYFKDMPSEMSKKTAYEESLGIKHLKIGTELPCEVQLIPVSAIAKSQLRDPNLKLTNPDSLLQKQSYILNIEYPLGFSAYYILSHILLNHHMLKGVYVIGKAAILTGDIGDVQVPKIIFDERTNNIIHPHNIFNEFFPFPTFQSSVLQNQKAISVYGTFLENDSQLQNYTASGFNIIEMESGPYLTAILHAQQDWNTVPHDQVAYIDNLPFDLGIINYASDNPLSHTLGEGTLSLKGVEPTYLAALTSLQRIIDLESQ